MKRRSTVKGQRARVLALVMALGLSGCTQAADLVWKLDREAAYRRVAKMEGGGE